MVALPQVITAEPVTLPWSKRAPGIGADAAAIISFLRSTIADAIHLVAIVPDGPVLGRWFGADAAAAGAWAAERNADGANLYWTVNRVRDALNGKPRKSDIAAARFAHVDIDPPKDGRTWDRAGALAALAELDSAPSFVIDSGGGLQGFWRLEDETLNLDAIEAVNTGIRDQFNADACQNIDRLMRVPATVNWPDRRKRERGRLPALAAMAVEDDGTVHDAILLAHRFPRAVPAADTADRPAVAQSVSALFTADDLALGAFNPIRMAIEQPPARDRSRDAQACAGDMVRGGFSDEQIMGVLLNPANPVAAHCLGQSNAPRAAARCLSRARADQDRKERETAEGAAIASAMLPAVIDAASGTISATPYVGRPASAIPLRPWVYGRQLLRNTIAAVVAPGGVGKSSLMVGTALALATGQPLLAKPVWDGPKTVWLWNLEDDGDELSRQIEAACVHHGIRPDDYAGRLYVDSGLDGQGLCTAIEGKNGVVVLKPVFDALAAELTARGIDVLIVDPFVSSHQVDENANTKIDAIAKEWARLAKRCHCAIVLVHHAGKMAGKKVTSEASRGASALVAAARSTLVLNRLDDDDAKRLQIPLRDQRRYFSVGDDKHNRSPAEQADWYRMDSVSLGNGGLEGGDSVGVVVPWTPPRASEQVSAADLWRVQNAIASGSWRFDTRAKSAWVGVVIAGVLGLDPEDDRERLKELLKGWISAGSFQVVQVKNADTNYIERSFVEVANWVIRPDPSVTGPMEIN